MTPDATFTNVGLTDPPRRQFYTNVPGELSQADTVYESRYDEATHPSYHAPQPSYHAPQQQEWDQWQKGDR